MKIILNKEQSKLFYECLMPAIRKLAREEKLKQLKTNTQSNVKTAGAFSSTLYRNLNKKESSNSVQSSY